MPRARARLYVADLVHAIVDYLRRRRQATSEQCKAGPRYNFLVVFMQTVQGPRNSEALIRWMTPKSSIYRLQVDCSE